MLLEMHRPREALAAYEAVLRDVPRRFNALAGACRAAQASGQPATARRYASALLDLAKDGDSDRPEIAEARRIAGSSTTPR